jgi:hypothetical protein
MNIKEDAVTLNVFAPIESFWFQVQDGKPQGSADCESS